MNPQTINSWQMGTPSTWAQIPPANPAPDRWPRDWPDVVAAELADSRRTGRLAKRLRSLHEVLTDVRFALLAVWVPDREAGEVAAHLGVTTLTAETGVGMTPQYARGLFAAERHAGLEVFHHSIEDVDLPAGPAMVVSEIIGGRLRGPQPKLHTVQEFVTVVLFPEGALDALQIDFVAHGVDVNSEGGFDDQIWACLQTLTVAVDEGER